jgi:putative methionine-R-sulfoxide reductase with GAF domain
MRLDALAIPIQSEGQVIGVVYADSSERDFFDQETVDLCIQISGAITQHILTTYIQG